MNSKFKEYLECAVQYNELSKQYVNKICEILTTESPSNNQWYFRQGFFCVDVVKKDYNSYMKFIEDTVGCSYCHVMNTNGLTFMMSLTTLNEKL